MPVHGEANGPERALDAHQPLGDRAQDHAREREQQQRGRDVAQQHVLEHVRGEEVVLAEAVERAGHGQPAAPAMPGGEERGLQRARARGRPPPRARAGSAARRSPPAPRSAPARTGRAASGGRDRYRARRDCRNRVVTRNAAARQRSAPWPPSSPAPGRSSCPRSAGSAGRMRGWGAAVPGLPLGAALARAGGGEGGGGRGLGAGGLRGAGPGPGARAEVPRRGRAGRADGGGDLRRRARAGGRAGARAAAPAPPPAAGLQPGGAAGGGARAAQRASPVADCLERRGPASARQVGRDRARAPARARAIERARARCPARAVLVDDVCTTGATLAACAAALRAAGTEEVSAVVYAGPWADSSHALGLAPAARLRNIDRRETPHSDKESRMRISVKGRNVPVDDELRKRVDKKFAKVARQVSELADMEVELSEERNPSIRDSQVVELTLHLKGVTLRAHEASEDMVHSLNLAAEDISRAGEAPPGEAPQAPRGASRLPSHRVARASALVSDPWRCSTRPCAWARARSSSSSRRRSRASTTTSPSWSSSPTRSCARATRRCASARRTASRSTSCCSRPSRSPARPPSARSASATSTSS